MGARLGLSPLGYLKTVQVGPPQTQTNGTCQSHRAAGPLPLEVAVMDL